MDLWNRSKAFGITPSEYMRVSEMASRESGLHGEWGLLCYHFDEAVHIVGSHLKSEIESLYYELAKNHKGELTKRVQDNYMKQAYEQALKSKQERHEERLVKRRGQMAPAPGVIRVGGK